MLILGLYSGHHDASAALFDDYRMVAAVAQERMTRRKIDGGRIPIEAMEEVLIAAGADLRDIGAVVLGRGAFPMRYFTHLPPHRRLQRALRALGGAEKHKTMEAECVRYARTDSEAMFDAPRFLRDLGLPSGIPLRFFNHHLAHALPTLFHTDWEDALLWTADGGGDHVQYSMRALRGGALETWFGGDEELARPLRIDSLGLAYGFATEALGFTMNRHEGKVTGLAAFGAPEIAPALAAHFSVSSSVEIASDFADIPAMRRFVHEWAAGKPREVVAASVQKVLEEVALAAVERLLARSGSRRLGLSGGVVANVRLNQLLAEKLAVDEVFVYPAMSDQGLPAGGILQYLLERDGLQAWLARRYRLEHLYLGRDWGAEAGSRLGATPGLVALDPGGESPAAAAARRIAAGEAIAIYTKGMEYGPRALGARSILAAPFDRAINDTLNARLDRSEFMPFAPVVREEDADTIFALGPAKSYAARFMTITCSVRPAWRERIAAAVHVDGTARPQVIRREPNPLYFDVLTEFARITGVPVLINTSFNAHEEPIINTPEECARALLDGRVDAVLTEGGLYARAAAPP